MNTSFVITNHEQKIVGYALGHTINDILEPPKLNHVDLYVVKSVNSKEIVYQKKVEKDTNRCFFIHDLSVLPEYRGIGLGKELLQALLDTAFAKKCIIISCMSVQNSFEFWSKYGFSEIDIPESALETYGKTARYMVKYLI